MSEGVKINGAPSLEELESSPGYPEFEVLKQKSCAVIECVEEIPCNPCETLCPQNAITVGDNITALPAIDPKKCNACGLCSAGCPGLAITIKNYNYEPERSLITFPWEYLPVPEKGDSVQLVNRFGREVCEGEVIRINRAGKFDRTLLVSAAFNKKHIMEVCGMRRLGY